MARGTLARWASEATEAASLTALEAKAQTEVSQGPALPKAGEEGLLRAFLFASRVAGSAGCPWPVHTALTPLTALGILPCVFPGVAVSVSVLF